MDTVAAAAASRAEPIIAGFAVIGVLLIIRAFLGYRPRFLREPDPTVKTGIERGQPSADAENDEPSADQIYLEAARLQLTLQISAYDVLDSKSSAAVGAGSFVLPLALAFLDWTEGTPQPLVIGLLAAAVCAYFILLLSAARLAHPRPRVPSDDARAAPERRPSQGNRAKAMVGRGSRHLRRVESAGSCNEGPLRGHGSCRPLRRRLSGWARHPRLVTVNGHSSAAAAGLATG